MKLSEVAIDQVYVVRISGRLAPVKLVSEYKPSIHTVRRFYGYNLATGKQVTLTAAKCRRIITDRAMAIRLGYLTQAQADKHWPEAGPVRGN